MTGHGRTTTVRAYIGLGSNLQNPLQQLCWALQALAALPGSSDLVRSPLYRSEPLGPPGQPPYINAVAGVMTKLPAVELLRALQAIETAQGRVRNERWGPRTLDLDILLYGDSVQTDPQLSIPHPRLAERAFVLYPLADIAPDLVIPGLGKLAERLHACPYLGLERLPETATMQHSMS